MQIEVMAKMLSAESTPYEMNGNSGVSHKIRLAVDGEIYVCKSSADQVKLMERYVGDDATAVIKVNSRKENLSLSLVSFDVE